MFKVRIAVLITFAALALGACSKDEAATAAERAAAAATAAKSPATAFQSIGDSLKVNDVDSLLRAVMAKPMYDSLRAEFDKKAPPTESDRQMFAAALQKVTGPQAIDDVMAMIEPQLAQVKPQMQMGVGLMKMHMMKMRASGGNVPAEYKAQVSALADGMGQWVERTSFDAATVRKALTALQDAVKATGITTADQLHALSYEQLMAKASTLLGGIKSALRHFNLDLDTIADSRKTTLVSESGDDAVVQTSITLFGVVLEGEVPLVRIDGNWYPEASRVALDVYNQYIVRTQVSEAEAGARVVKMDLSEHFAVFSTPPAAGKFNDTVGSRYMQSAVHDAEGVITVTLRDAAPTNASVRGYQFTLRPKLENHGEFVIITDWACAPVSPWPADLLPSRCLR